MVFDKNYIWNKEKKKFFFSGRVAAPPKVASQETLRDEEFLGLQRHVKKPWKYRIRAYYKI